jgi:hypothetical protein
MRRVPYTFGSKAVMMSFVGEVSPADFEALAQGCRDVSLEFGLPAGIDAAFDPETLLFEVTFVLDLDDQRLHAPQIAELADHLEARYRSLRGVNSVHVTLGVGIIHPPDGHA